MSVSEENNNEKRKYFCAFDTFLGMERHIFVRIWFGIAHCFGLQGLYWMLTGQVPLRVILFLFLHGYFAGLGLTVAGHRYWAHKSFKAKLPMRLLMIYMHTAAGQFPVFEYVRIHRTHHKHADTECDPHNAQRGFWWSQIGWLLTKESPLVTEKRDKFNFSDVDNDPLVRFQSKYYWILLFITMFAVPISIYSLLWPVSLYTLICINYAQYLLGTHLAFLANSLTHLKPWGNIRPYDKRIFPVEHKITAIITYGEGWHNYHHVFPWDYKISETGFGKYNWSTGFIELCALLGWAYDLKTASPEMVEYKAKRLGDGSHPHYGDQSTQYEEASPHPGTWGLEDPDTPQEDYKMVQTLRPSKTG